MQVCPGLCGSAGDKVALPQFSVQLVQTTRSWFPCDGLSGDLWNTALCLLSGESLSCQGKHWEDVSQAVVTLQLKGWQL